MSGDTFTDEELTAFLDGEADDDLNDAIAAALETDAQLTARLEALDVPVAIIRAQYDSLLAEAPEFDMEESVSVDRMARPWGLAAGTFAAGLAAGLAFFLFWPTATPEPSAPGWKAVVASYQSLYGPETLQADAPDADATRTQLAQVADAIGLDLSDLPAAAGLEFKRAQVLNFRGRPLAQLAYLRDDGTPVALCIIKSAESEPVPMNTATITGLGSASWNAGGYGYLLIGGDDLERIQSEALPFARWSQAAT